MNHSDISIFAHGYYTQPSCSSLLRSAENDGLTIGEMSMSSMRGMEKKELGEKVVAGCN